MQAGSCVQLSVECTVAHCPCAVDGHAVLVHADQEVFGPAPRKMLHLHDPQEQMLELAVYESTLLLLLLLLLLSLLLRFALGAAAAAGAPAPLPLMSAKPGWVLARSWS